jgi:hypothetical protein
MEAWSVVRNGAPLQRLHQTPCLDTTRCPAGAGRGEEVDPGGSPPGESKAAAAGGRSIQCGAPPPASSPAPPPAPLGRRVGDVGVDRVSGIWPSAFRRC